MTMACQESHRVRVCVMDSLAFIRSPSPVINNTTRATTMASTFPCEGLWTIGSSNKDTSDAACHGVTVERS